MYPNKPTVLSIVVILIIIMELLNLIYHYRTQNHTIYSLNYIFIIRYLRITNESMFLRYHETAVKKTQINTQLLCTFITHDVTTMIASICSHVPTKQRVEKQILTIHFCSHLNPFLLLPLFLR